MERVMLVNPKKGQKVILHYRKADQHERPYHGMTGTVHIVSKGKPRNHGVLIDINPSGAQAGAQSPHNVGGSETGRRPVGRLLVVVPCGNLRKATETRAAA